MSGRSICRYCCLALIVWATARAEESTRPAVLEVVGDRPFLRYERPPYRNFAFNHFTQYPDHTWGARTVGGQIGVSVGIDRQQALYDPLGNYLANGFDLYSWIERRQPEQRFGSELFKDWSAWQHVFTNVVVGRDGYGDWGYSAFVGDGLMARFTPLTLSKTDLNGLRLDLSLPHVKFTAVGSRIARPNRESYLFSENVAEVEVDNSTFLLGTRAQAHIGRLRLGLNGVNLHPYDSTQPGNSMKGRLRTHRRPNLAQPLYQWLLVRFADDAPADGKGGAVVQEVQLILNGQERPDLRPHVVRHRAATPSQVGRTLSSGDFLPVFYNSLSGPRNYYLGREIPLYADYLYLLAHAEGADVGKETHLEGLLAGFALEDPERILRADGEEQLIYLFDLGREPYVESLQVEAVLGNDYRVEWAGVYLTPSNETASQLEQRFSSTFYRPARRARGSVEDGSNFRRVRFEVGENTAIFTYSADAHLELPGLEVSGEYARSAVYRRYPAHLEGSPLFASSPRFAHRGSAYFVNAVHWFGRGRAGAEYFSMNPDFTTEMETYLPKDFGYRSSRGYSPHAGLSNSTIIWRLVQDNEDGDRYPDVLLGNVLGSPQAGARDLDGVFLGQDEDNDGVVDTDRNFNGLPDYDENFMMYWVEPNEYVYGLDRNHNDEPDQREDDWVADYPHDPDQRGFHLFGQVDLSRHWSLGAGRYAVEALAGGGRNHSTYALLTYQREAVARRQRLLFENYFRRVEDDIPDEFIQFSRTVELIRINEYSSGFSGVVQELAGGLKRHADQLFYQDSYVNETYMEGQFRPWSTLRLVQKLRLRLNWQQQGQLANDRFQRGRRLDLWAVTSRADYTWQWGKLRVVPQFKVLLLRLADQEAGVDLRSEYRVIPILKLRYALMNRTVLQAGVQGWGPLPYRLEDRIRKRESLEQRTAIFTLTNRSRYFGYDMHTIIGLRQEELDFDNRFQRFRNFDGWSFFVRNLIGFTEFGQLL